VALAVLATMAGAFAVLGDDVSGEPVPIASVTSFDPEGDNRAEREDLVTNAIDGDPTTLWQSERYRDPEALAGKSGVGLVLAVDQPRQFTGVELRSPDAGWDAELYVMNGSTPEDLAGWGEPAGTVTDARAGVTTVDLEGRQADRVLVWFTRLPTSGVMQVADVMVRGR
jgi:hypothetical protein